MFTRIQLQAKSFRWRPSLTTILIFVWGFFIIYGTLLPFDLSEPADRVHDRMRQLWEKPWRPSSRTDLVSNVLLFMPWGFLIAVWATDRKIHPAPMVAVAISSAAILSGSVEFIQLYTPTRTTSFVDLATNTTGSALGALIGWPFARFLWPELSKKLRRLIAVYPLTSCAAAATIGLVFAGLVPFDVSLDMGDMKSALARSRPIPFGPPLRGLGPSWKPWSWSGETLSWLLVGGILALAAREFHRRGLAAVGGAVVIAGWVSLAIETIQIIIPSREVDMTSVILALFGAAAGAVIVERSATVSPRQWITPALLVWCATIALSAWTPPELAWPEPPYLRPERFLPFWSYYTSSRLTDLAGLFGQLLAFVPLGALLAVRYARQSIRSAAALGFIVGFLFEFGQIFLPTRTAEITSVLMAATGAGLGVALWRWGEALHHTTQGAARYRVGPGAGRVD